MNFGVKRLYLANADHACYHLYNPEHRLALVAEQGTPWLPHELEHHVRFARPDGTPLAALDLPWGGHYVNRHNYEMTAFALTIEHAVYAILNKYTPADMGTTLMPYYVIEVEDSLLLALNREENGADYYLYDDLPPDLTFSDPASLALPAAVAYIHPGNNDYNFVIQTQSLELKETPLLLLALTFLIDEAGE